MKYDVFKTKTSKYIFSFLLISIVTTADAFAKRSVKIFDARRSFALNKGQKTYKDYYINGGSEFGLKPGMLINVQRRMTLYDSFQNKSPGDLLINVGKIKIIHVQSGISVAREYSLEKRNNQPLLEYNYIMVGDKLDLNSVKMDKGRAQVPISKPKASRSTARLKKQKAKADSFSFSSTNSDPVEISVY